MFLGNKEADFPSGLVVENPPAMQETWVRSLGHEDPPEKEMTTHSSILIWENPWQVAVHGVAKSRTWLRDWTTRSLLAFCCRGLEALILSWEKKEIFKKKKVKIDWSISLCCPNRDVRREKWSFKNVLSLSFLLSLGNPMPLQWTSQFIPCPDTVSWNLMRGLPLGGTGLCVPCPPHEQGFHEWLWSAG